MTMADLLDLKPATGSVEIDGQEIPIRAIDLAGVLDIILRFPALQAAVSGGNKTISWPELLGTGSVPAIIASGCGHHGDKEREALAAMLGADRQASLAIPIVLLTMPRGVGPFLSRLVEFTPALRPAEAITREELARKAMRKDLRKSSPSSSSNTEAPLAAMPS